MGLVLNYTRAQDEFIQSSSCQAGRIICASVDKGVRKWSLMSCAHAVILINEAVELMNL